jgi:hypothetical protein
MRTLIRFSIPVGPGNRAIQDGRLGPVIGKLIEQLRPEASWFLTQGGKRTGMLVCDLADASRIPVVAEPLFVELEAEVDFAPLMSLEDLQRGLAAAGGAR